MTRWLPVSLVLCSTSIAGAESPAPDPVTACYAVAADAKLSLTFKPDASMTDLATWITGTTCKNVVFDAAIAKRAIKATIVSPNKYTPKQALQLVVDAIESTGLVVTQKPDTIIIKLGPTMPRACPDLAVAPTGDTRNGPTKPEAKDPDADAIVAKLDAGIKKLDDTHYEVKRSLVDAVLANPMAVMKGARVVPAMKNGKPTGIKLYAIRPSSAYAKLGFRNGDTVISVNKLSLVEPDDALEAYTQLREAKKFEVELERTGKPLTLVFTLK